MRILLRLLGFQRKYWRRMTLAFLCMVAATGFALAVPWLLGQAIDLVLTQGEVRLLILSAGAIILASILRGAFAYGQSYLGEFTSQRLAYDIRNAIYERLQRLSFSFYDTAQTGQLMSRATADVEGARWFASVGVIRLVYSLVLFLAITVILYLLNWRLALLSLACLSLLGVRAVVVSRRLRFIWQRIHEGMASLGVTLQENLAGIRVVKAFAQGESEAKKFTDKAEVIYQENLAASLLQAFNMPLMAFILTATIGLVVWVGGHEVAADRLTPGNLAKFVFYLLMMAMPVRMLGPIANMVSRAMASGQRIFEILDAEVDVKEKPGARELPRARGLVRFEGVSFSYNSQGPSLQDIDFEARPGQVIALVGATGSGKSTIASLIPRFYDVTQGRVTIDGVDVREVTLHSLRRNVGIVHQDIFLFTATLRENIAYGNTGATGDEIVAAIRTARLEEFVRSLPQGLNTWVGEQGITLSGGQKQRVAIARTLLTDPAILILDDSTSSIDAATEQLLREALAELMKGRTTFIITQRLQTIQHGDQILVLEGGKIVERGRHEELLARGGLYYRMCSLQLGEAAALAQPVTVRQELVGKG